MLPHGGFPVKTACFVPLPRDRRRKELHLLDAVATIFWTARWSMHTGAPARGKTQTWLICSAKYGLPVARKFRL